MDDQYQRIHQIFASFREVNQVFHQSLLKIAQGFGVTPIQFLVLKTLAERPRIGLAALADCLYVGNSTTSGIVERLVKAGFVERERSKEDRRSISLKLTPKGENLLERVNEERIDRLLPLLELPEEDQRELQRIHSRIVQILQRVREVKP